MYHGEEKPCDEAFGYPHERWHIRACSEEEYNRLFSEQEGLWRSKGKNHGITEKGRIIRQEEDIVDWTVEINSLDELNAFAEKYGELVISIEPHGSPWIEIYDDYRE